MSIYKLAYRVRSYLSFVVSPEELEDKLGSVTYPNGKPLASLWQPMVATLYNRYNDNAEGKMPDISDWVGNMVFSDAAFAALESMLSPFGEFLPLQVGENGWYVYNATEIYNCVDSSKSSRNVIDGLVMDITSLAFDETKLGPAPVFRTDYDRRMSVYCNQSFKDAVQAHGFEAVLFREDLTAPM